MQTSPPIRIAIVEDRKEELEALEALIRGEPGFECNGVCRSAKEAIQVLPSLAVDVVLMDINLPDGTGIDCLRRIASQMESVQFMMLTVIEDHEAIYQSLQAGATGYLLKKTPASRIVEAIRELHDGGAPMSGQIARKVISAFRLSEQPLPATRANKTALASTQVLSEIEEKVLNLLGRGLLYKEVARDLNMSMGTVRTHVWHIYRKLQVHNRTEALNRNRKLGAGP